MEHHQPSWSFDMMAFIFRIRDLFNSRERVLKEVPLEEGMIVLDYGTGSGAYIEATLKRIGLKGTYHAADINPRAEKYVERIRKNTRHPNIEFILTDCKTGLVSSSVDVAYLHDIYHELPDPESILKELRRVLRKDGVLSFNDHHLKGDVIQRDEFLSKHFRIVEKGKRTYIMKKT
jgi:ubiquinone/menaquinone biosynthesis C-methylase UbiE